jgi:hypothetical protein
VCIGSQANVRRKKQTYHIAAVTLIVIVIVTVAMNRDAVVGILARLQAGQPGHRFSIRGWGEGVFPSRQRLWPDQPRIQRAPGVLFPVVKK